MSGDCVCSIQRMQSWHFWHHRSSLSGSCIQFNLQLALATAAWKRRKVLFSLQSSIQKNFELTTYLAGGLQQPSLRAVQS